jgi:hypothetical protein
MIHTHTDIIRLGTFVLGDQMYVGYLCVFLNVVYRRRSVMYTENRQTLEHWE